MVSNLQRDNTAQQSAPILFTNVRILDGTGELPYPGEVLVQGNRIKRITRAFAGAAAAPHEAGPVNIVDGGGATLMPGLIDAHLHLSWNNAPGIDPIQMMPPEEHILVTAEMAKLVLDAGFTAGRGAAAAKPRLDVVIRNFINAGKIPGPRYTAAGPEITTVGGLGDSPHRISPMRASTSALWSPAPRKCAARCGLSSSTGSIRSS